MREVKSLISDGIKDLEARFVLQEARTYVHPERNRENSPMGATERTQISLSSLITILHFIHWRSRP